MPLKGTKVEPLVSDHLKREDFVVAKGGGCLYENRNTGNLLRQEVPTFLLFSRECIVHTF